ncbi:Hypothetical predicted protein [Lecanosticta acicola]|uniref:Uncharacterized protein n=1 Tax=Lecanosticta acicola TaxID=111012 RepID=A0AAI8Z5H7_9PEZI|nr:Hypothetical predicted protein [Lecanosticta acicola]
MSEERSLFNPPPETSKMKRSNSSTRSVHSVASVPGSKSSRRARVWSLLGRRRNDARADSPTLRFPRFSSMGSIASGDSTSTTSSDKSTTSSISTVSKRSMKSSRSTLPDLTDLDLFGVKLPPTEEQLAPTAPNGVELAGRAYRVPEPIDKEFYRDLTMLEDEELIRKYGLIQVTDTEEAASEPKQSKPEISRFAYLDPFRSW